MMNQTERHFSVWYTFPSLVSSGEINPARLLGSALLLFGGKSFSICFCFFSSSVFFNFLDVLSNQRFNYTIIIQFNLYYFKLFFAIIFICLNHHFTLFQIHRILILHKNHLTRFRRLWNIDETEFRPNDVTLNSNKSFRALQMPRGSALLGKRYIPVPVFQVGGWYLLSVDEYFAPYNLPWFPLICGNGKASKAWYFFIGKEVLPCFVGAWVKLHISKEDQHVQLHLQSLEKTLPRPHLEQNGLSWFLQWKRPCPRCLHLHQDWVLS